ncbi:MAG: BrnT family toxin [Pseudolabrys sp.]|nr:BrnT family toxin [Pseudolabrys sp.]MDP2295605.1 BrnT family toxin [Pseudolabrys sp.]
MNVAFDGFDWDAGNRQKCQKHGLSIAEIEAFLLADPRTAPDLRHSAREERLMAVGRGSRGRAIFVVFTVRVRDGKHLIRPLMARHMHKKEIEGYEAEES